MEQLIFFAVIIFFSIIESIARSRKQRQGGQLPPAPGEAPPEWEAERRPEQPRRQRPMRPSPGPSDVPTYDDDASFDARTSEEGRTSETGRSFDETASSEEERRKRAASSESMIPADIWEEIAGLAREAKVELPLPPPRPKPQPKPLPQPKPRPTAPPRRDLPQPRRPPPPRAPTTKLPSLPRPPRQIVPLPEPALEGTAAHAVHDSHVGYGTDPSERARSAQDGMDPLARILGADASAVRTQLRAQGPHALRQALILYEVLGPPVGSRSE